MFWNCKKVSKFTCSLALKVRGIYQRGLNRLFTFVGLSTPLFKDVPSLIVGTLVKESASDGDNDKQDSPLLHPRSRCRDSDQLYLEDESGRVALQVDNVHEYCTGIVVGVKGAVDKNGILPVEEMYTPEPKAHAKLQAPSLQSSGGSQAPHLLLVSGLRCGDADVSSLPRDMLLAYLQGHFTPDAQKVCRVIICGGGPSSAPTTNGSMSSSTFGVRELDTWGLQLGATGIPVDILPGKLDPTTANWPQRPFHSSLFPKSKSTGLWNHSPNPYAAGHGPRLVIGTDGENVHDLCHSMLAKVKESEITKDSPSDDSHDNVQERSSYIPISELEALKKTLEWAHMCPTGPDSVPTIPHPEMDPMVLDTTPHVYFAGNATEFATDLVTNDEAGTSTRVVCVPNFADTGAAVLVNLETLGVEVLRFEDDCNSR